MASNNYQDEVFKAKRRIKTEIKFHITLNDEQKKAKSQILENVITILKGKAGSGKSLVASQIALDLLFRKEVEKIIITRPVVEAAATIGFLPGNIIDKLSPFTAPIMDNMFRLYEKEKIESLISDGSIEILPLNFMRGRNFTNSIVLVDEGQNITHDQMHLLLGRICHGTKMIICGDNSQIDLKVKKDSGFDFACKHLCTIRGISVITLQTNHRHPIVEDILQVYAEF